MSLDLSKKNLSEIAEAGHEFELRLPGSKEKTGAFIKVRGEQSKVVKSYTRKTIEGLQAKNSRKRKGDNDAFDLSMEEAEEMAVEAAVVRIIDWRGIELEGKAVPFSKENAIRILTEHSWIREQVQDEASEQLNFLG
jgi:hypothetical protein